MDKITIPEMNYEIDDYFSDTYYEELYIIEDITYSLQNEHWVYEVYSITSKERFDFVVASTDSYTDYIKLKPECPLCESNDVIHCADSSGSRYVLNEYNIEFACYDSDCEVSRFSY